MGRLVSAKKIDESLPSDMIALILYQRLKIGEIDYEGLAESVKEEIKDRVQELYFVLTNFIEEQPPSIIPIRPPIRVVNPIRPIIVFVPQDLPRIIVIIRRVEFSVETVEPETPVSLELENSTISKIEMRLAETREKVNMTIEKLDEKPPELPEPHGLVWAYHKISVNLPDEEIESARIGFWVLKDWLKTHKTHVEDITLLRYYARRWESLSTEVVEESPTHVNYSAETPGFSTFAITTVTPEVPPLRPAEFKVSDFTITPPAVEPGKEVTISVLVTNVGEQPGSYTITLRIASRLISIEDEAEVTLDGGESETVSFAYTMDVDGTYNVEVDGLTGSFEVLVVIPPSRPAEFEVSDLVISPDEVEEGEEVTITVEVKNVGEEEGSHTVELKIDGEVVDSETATLAGGASATISFEVLRGAGTYQVEVDGLTGSFTVSVKPVSFWLQPAYIYDS